MPALVDSATAHLKEMAPERLTSIMRWVNMVNAVLLIVAGAVAFSLLGECSQAPSCSTAGFFLLAFYTIFFAALLLAFEVKSEKGNEWINRNFGFMYSNRGRATMILFLATLAFSTIDTHLGSIWILILLIGLFTSFNGIFVCAAVYMNPTFDDYCSDVATGSVGDNHVGTFQPPPPPPVQSDYQFGDASATSTPFARPSDHPFAQGNPFSTI